MAKPDEGKQEADALTEGVSLTLEQEQALFKRYINSPTEENFDRIIEQYKNLVYFIVHKYFVGKDTFEDIVQVGMLGLVLAVKRFEPERGLRFSTFAFRTIRGEIQRYLRDKSWSIGVPRVLKERSLKVLTAQNLLALKLGCPPTIEQISQETKLTQEQVQEALEIGSAYHPLQIMEEILPSEVEISESDAGRKPSLQQVQDSILWNHMLSFLTEVEAEVLRLRFWEGLPQREVAIKLGTSQMNISRIQRIALAKLRKVIPSETYL